MNLILDDVLFINVATHRPHRERFSVGITNSFGIFFMLSRIRVNEILLAIDTFEVSQSEWNVLMAFGGR